MGTSSSWSYDDIIGGTSSHWTSNHGTIIATTGHGKLDNRIREREREVVAHRLVFIKEMWKFKFPTGWTDPSVAPVTLWRVIIHQTWRRNKPIV